MSAPPCRTEPGAAARRGRVRLSHPAPPYLGRLSRGVWCVFAREKCIECGGFCAAIARGALYDRAMLTCDATRCLRARCVPIGAMAVGAAAVDMDAQTIPPPHPVITEVLFNVPQGMEGDANKDAVRDAAGDEFVELMNPHSAPIALGGYTLTNRLTTGDPKVNRGVRFRFPEFELEPGGVVVVFNGYGASIPGPVGNDRGAPSGPNERFAGAWVFSMEMPSGNRAMANTADFILLSAPDGAAVDAVEWNGPRPGVPRGTRRTAEVRADPKGSVQRRGADGEMLPHREIDGRAFSPGEALTAGG